MSCRHRMNVGFYREAPHMKHTGSFKKSNVLACLCQRTNIRKKTQQLEKMKPESFTDGHQSIINEMQ